MTEPGPATSAATFATIPCDEFSAARADVENLAKRAGFEEHRVQAVVLVASELLSNACEHGAEVRMSTSTDGGDLEVVVSNEAPAGAVPPVHAWRMPADPLAPSGRGLAIVKRMADHVSVRWHDGRIAIATSFSLDTRPATSRPT